MVTLAADSGCSAHGWAPGLHPRVRRSGAKASRAGILPASGAPELAADPPWARLPCWCTRPGCFPGPRGTGQALQPPRTRCPAQDPAPGLAQAPRCSHEL
uniref:Uncharacterized protein n=1 Tax=Anser brachyrhynchus TaxID=132585 RepID=A0A8B9C613_9AVES